MTTTELVRTPDVSDELLGVLLAYKRKLTSEEIATMLERIQPVVRNKDGQLCHIEPVDPVKVSFVWAPALTTETAGLREIARIYTLHTWGYYGVFKPSLEEVLSMIPQHLIHKVSAFETIGPHHVDDLSRQQAAVDAGYHAAVTVLYS